MKKKIFIGIFLTVSLLFIGFSNMKAEEELFFGGQMDNGGYGGPTVSAAQINDEFGLYVGGRGAWIINHTFAIGFGGAGLVSNNLVKDYWQEVVNYNNYPETRFNDSSWYLSGGYGGLILEYIYNSDKMIHLTGNVLIGYGNLSYNDRPNSMNNNHNNYYDMYESYVRVSDDYFVIEPGINAELNIAKWFRIDLGASYRIVSGLDMPKTTNAQMSGLSGNLIFKFGKF